jgi:hypothetical protein
MDPYLEMPPYWGDFVPGFLSSVSCQLLPRILPTYDALIEEYAPITDDENHAQAHSDSEQPPQRHLVLIHRPTQKVVTVMELLSPWNKSASEGGLDAYLRKREELLAGHAHFVELDLLRGGQRLPMSKPLPPRDYYAFVGRTQRRPRGQVIAWSLRAEFPKIPIPLLPEDPEVSLDLGAAFRAAYEASLYDRRLPYHEPLVPPLAASDEAWLRDRLASAGHNAAVGKTSR